MSRPRSSASNDDRPRLQKVLAAAGVGSRRHCEELILAGRVVVDGKAANELGVRVDPFAQQIALDGEPIRVQAKRYYLLNKPRGVLCTNSDPAGRARVIDLFPEDGPRLFTVGRLDEHSQGLLLVTNDGELANRLAHPRYQVPRTYHLQVAGRPNREAFATLKRGLRFSDGQFRVESVRRLSSRGRSTKLEIVLRHGHNREVRRLFARIGHKVMQLKRVAFGPLKLGRLGEGRYRDLKPTELDALTNFDKPRRQASRHRPGKARPPTTRKRRR